VAIEANLPFERAVFVLKIYFRYIFVGLPHKPHLQATVPPPPRWFRGERHTRLRLPTNGEKVQHSAYSVHHSQDRAGIFKESMGARN
jgi:hypothetical protein